MASSQDETANTKNDKEAFRRQLHKRIAAIEDIWARLSEGAWDAGQLDALYERVREISESSKAHGLFQLNESVFSLEVYLSSFVGSDMHPGKAQIDAISGLVRALRTAADGVATHAELAPPGQGSVTIFVLGDKAGITADLAEALRRIDCDVRYFADAATLVLQLEQDQPKAIIADTAKLPEMSPLSAELVRLRSHLSLTIPLIFVSSSTALQLRVDAIRAGGDGYFVAPLETESVAAQVRDLATADQQAPFRVLVVEDDPTQADFAGSILRKAGIEVLQLTEPVKVLSSLREFKPDLILMDIYMPEVNGIELTTVIRDHAEFVTIPIVFVSGEQNADRQISALSVGGDDFIPKPISPRHLLGVVQNRIRRARQVLRATGQPPKHDRVTGLFSRQHFLDSTARLIDDDKTRDVAAVLLVRPDDLEGLRTRLGVGGVDHLLSELGDLLHRQTDPNDVAARIDDYSFGLLLKRSRQEEIIHVAEAILNQIAGHVFEGKQSISGSVGLYFLDDRTADANGVVSRAGSACDEASAHGGNRVHIHRVETDSVEITPSPDADLGQRVRHALHSDGFIIQYQPLLDLQTRGSETYEIVLRLANAQGDLIGGQQLLEAAEAADVCLELDQWILDRAIDILKQRRDSGRRTQIFVHQSVQTALNPDLATWLSGRLRAKQVVGTGLVIDFRLPDLSHNLKVAQSNIRALREMDVDVSLSRFPEKEAAFKVLRFLRAGYINIAPRLLKADREVISSVIRQAHQAKAKVIVSNVDDPRSIDLHWSSGADFLQGNFIQRPLENMDYDFSQVVI
jgi:PleD family two-component response regulator/EAL domain-containing protein (putative c-di-GMP-specific phosphodiesterase class I)